MNNQEWEEFKNFLKSIKELIDAGQDICLDDKKIKNVIFDNQRKDILKISFYRNASYENGVFKKCSFTPFREIQNFSFNVVLDLNNESYNQGLCLFLIIDKMAPFSCLEAIKKHISIVTRSPIDKKVQNKIKRKKIQEEKKKIKLEKEKKVIKELGNLSFIEL